MCDTKQGYTQYGGLRPFGVSFLIAGWDVHHGFQLYQSDPSGNYGGWKATAIGANNQAAQSILRQVLPTTKICGVGDNGCFDWASLGTEETEEGGVN